MTPSTTARDPLPAVRVRGIYATALSCLLVDLGYPIADSSPATTRRLRMAAPRNGSPRTYAPLVIY